MIKSRSGGSHRLCRYRALARAAGSLLAFLSVGCDDAPTTSVVFSLDDVWSFAQGAMREGPLPVVVAGRPDDAPEPVLAARVVAAVKSAMTWTATPRLQAAPAEAVAKAIRIVVVFSSDSGGCGERPEGGGPLGGGRVVMTMTLCAGVERLAEVSGRLGRSRGSDDPHFAALIRQATDDLFSQRHHP